MWNLRPGDRILQWRTCFDIDLWIGLRSICKRTLCWKGIDGIQPLYLLSGYLIPTRASFYHFSHQRSLMSNSATVVQVGEEGRELSHSNSTLYFRCQGVVHVLTQSSNWRGGVRLVMEPFLVSTEKNIISVKFVLLLPWVTDGQWWVRMSKRKGALGMSFNGIQISWHG